jgi:hypothetical protein
VVGGFFLWTGGIHVGLLSADPTVYRHFADAALFGFVSRGWASVFMAEPRLWAAALALAETVAGALLLTRGRGVAIGWAAVIVFHALLLLFGFGFWLWSVPALVVLSALAWADRSEWRSVTTPSPTSAPPAFTPRPPRNVPKASGSA